MHAEHLQGDYRITTDPARFDIAMVHGYLTNCYWAEGIPRETVERSIAGALCFGLFARDAQIGFARVITDYATYAYLADVFILEPHRGKGLSAWMMECILADSRLQGLRRWSLVTRDAHGLYEKFGFTALANPQRYMEKIIPNVYKRS
jgi:GNAT superfamily N-acetyltransferase